MVRWLTIVVLAVSCTWPAAARAQPTSGVQASVTTHGLRMTLRAPRRTYPENAVIAVTLTLRNISKHRVSVGSGGYAPRFLAQGYDSEQPLGDQTLLIPKGPGPGADILRPGAAWTIHTYVILGGPRLSTSIILVHIPNFSRLVTVDGPELRFHLTSEQAPHVTISTAPLHATLTSPVPVSSSFLWTSQTRCDTGPQTAGLTATPWTIGDSGQVQPDTETVGCTHFIWHALAGWLGHPVAAVSYETGGAAELGDGLNYPEVDVLGRHGKVIFPPALHVPAIGPAMPNPFPYAVMPGQVIRRHGFVVLRGNSVRAQVPLDLDGTLPGTAVRTPVLHVALTKPDRPRTHIRGVSEGVRIDPVGTASGRLRFMDWAQCEYPPPASPTINGVYLWTTASTSITALHYVGKDVRITPSCPALKPGGPTGRVVQWQLIAGWPNHTVATVDFAGT